MTWSILLYSLATAGMATAQNLWQLVAWRIFVGFGMGGEWSAGSVLVAETWPAQHRAKAMGLMQAGWAIGALLAAGISSLVLETYGWRVFFLIGAAPAALGLPDPPQRRGAAAVARAAGERRPASARSSRRPTAGMVLLATLLAASVLTAYWGVTSWLPGFLATPVAEGGAGLSLTSSARWLILLQVGAFFGYITFGFIADRIGRRLAFTLFMIGATIGGADLRLRRPRDRDPAFHRAAGRLLRPRLFLAFRRDARRAFPDPPPGHRPRLLLQLRAASPSALAPFGIGVAATHYGLRLRDRQRRGVFRPRGRADLVPARNQRPRSSRLGVADHLDVAAAGQRLRRFRRQSASTAPSQ